MGELPCPFMSSQGCGDWEAVIGNVFGWSWRQRAKIAEVGRRNRTGSSAPRAPCSSKLCLCFFCSFFWIWCLAEEAAFALSAGYLEREGWTAFGSLLQTKTSWRPLKQEIVMSCLISIWMPSLSFISACRYLWHKAATAQLDLSFLIELIALSCPQELKIPLVLFQSIMFHFS